MLLFVHGDSYDTRIRRREGTNIICNEPRMHERARVQQIITGRYNMVIMYGTVEYHELYPLTQLVMLTTTSP